MEILQGRHKIQLDDADFKRLGGALIYASRVSADVWYARVNNKYLHRVVLNAPVGVRVDHKNHDTLDCRRANLRLCTQQENLRNRKGANKTSQSGVRGVSWDKSRGRWAARVRIPGKYLALGRFTRKADAKKAVIAAREIHFGEFAGAA